MSSTPPTVLYITEHLPPTKMEASILVVLWSAYDERCISIPDIVDQHRQAFNQKYLDLIDDVSLASPKDINIIQSLTLPTGFSFWFASSAFEKSVLKSPVIYDMYRVFALDWLIQNNNIDKVVCTLPSKKVRRCIQDLCGFHGVIYDIRMNRRFQSMDLKKYLPHFIRAHIVLFRSVMMWVVARILLDRVNLKSSMGQKQITLMSYFPGFRFASNNQQPAESIFWGQLPDCINQAGCMINHLILYGGFPSLLVMKKLLQLKKISQEDCVNRYYLLEQAFTLKSILSVARLFYSIYFKKKSHCKLCLHHLGHDQVIYRFLLKPLINTSVGGSDLMASCLFYVSIEKLLEQLPQQSKCFYLFENQGWERILNFHWKQMQHAPIYGCIHSMMSPIDMRYSVDSKTIASRSPYCYEATLPSSIIANGPFSFHRLSDNTMPVMLAEALRFKRESLRYSRGRVSSGSAFHLMCCTDLLKSSAIYFMCFLSEFYERYKNDIDIKITIRMHPYLPKAVKLFKSILSDDNPDISIDAAVSMNDQLSQSNLCLTTCATNVAVETLSLGIPTCILRNPNMANINPLFDQKYLFVRTVQDLYKVIRDIDCFPHTVDAQQYYCIDQSLPRWKKIITSLDL